MKPYILNYSESTPLTPGAMTYMDTLQINVSTGGHLNTDSTIQTRTLESDDSDEFYLNPTDTLKNTSTIVTKTLEATDDDSIFSESTLSTATTEPSDPDELDTLALYKYKKDHLSCMSTVSTESIEPSDPDEITLN